MTILLTIAAAIAFALGMNLYVQAITIFHEILASVFLLMSIVMACAVALLHRINRVLPKHPG